MPAIMILLSLLAWLFAVVLFEAAYSAWRVQLASHVSKPLAARIWWAFLLVITISQGAAGLIQILAIVPIALSHIDLASRKPDVIPLREVLVNIPAALRSAFQKIKPFLR